MEQLIGFGSGVVGHSRILGLLEREFASPANSYMFVGAAGVGKATIARAFAAALLCPQGEDHGSEGCRSCRLVLTGRHPDLVLLEPEGRQSLGVSQARETIAQAVLAPVESARKVFLIEEGSSMTVQAANALLKTLEEPTPTTVFLLVVESETDLPATVSSRCRTIHVGRVDPEDIRTALAGLGVETERADALARISGGRPGLAFTLAKSTEAAEFRIAWLNVPLQVSDVPGEAFALAQAMLDTVEPLVGVRVEASESKASREKAEREARRSRQALLATGLELTASWYADAAAVQYGGPIRNTDIPVASLTRVPPTVAVRNCELCLDAVRDLNANLRPNLLMANLFLSLAAEA